MDFSLTSDQLALQSSIRDFLDKEATTVAVRKIAFEQNGFDKSVWSKAAEMGWTGLVIPEKFGGIGMGWLEAALLAEEMGRALLPLPYLSTFLAASVILDGEEEIRKRYLPSLAAGETIATLAIFEGRGNRSTDVQMKARPENGGVVLEGNKLFVADGTSAGLFVVAAQGSDGLGFFVVDKSSKGVEVEALPVIDRTRPQSAVTFNEVHVESSNAISGAGVFEKIRDRAALLIAAEQTGVARRCLELSLEYAKTRNQFGKPIGSYQAVAHKIADMYLGAEHSASLLYYAGWAADHDPLEAPAAAWRARVWSSQAARKASADSIQVHGGIGFTWEHDLHLYFKRAKANEVFFSDPRSLRELISNTLHSD